MTDFDQRLAGELEEFKTAGVYKRMNYLEGPQAARVPMEGRGEVVILSHDQRHNGWNVGMYL